VKTVWVNRKGLLQNRARGQQYGDPVIFVHDGEKLHTGYGLRLLGPSQFEYVNLNGRFAIELKTEGSIEVETSRGKWQVLP